MTSLSEHTNIIPIFILGVQRSGTTWLANILCNHSLIVGIQHDLHYGIHESAFFSRVIAKFNNFDLKNKNDLIAFIEAFSASDYFKIAGIDKRIFFEKLPSDFFEFFKILMDEFAKKHNAKFWLEKSPGHTPLKNNLSEKYGNARFIAIKRDFCETIKSTHKKFFEGKQRKNMFLRAVIRRYVTYEYAIESYKKQRGNFLLIRYTDLKSNKEKEIRKTCNFLNINYESNMLIDKFTKNTSFKNEEERKVIFSSQDKKMLNYYHKFYHLSYFVKSKLNFLKPQANENVTKELPKWFYSFYKQENSIS